MFKQVRCGDGCLQSQHSEGWGSRISMSLSPGWTITWYQGHPELHIKTSSKKLKRKKISTYLVFLKVQFGSQKSNSGPLIIQLLSKGSVLPMIWWQSWWQSQKTRASSAPPKLPIATTMMLGFHCIPHEMVSHVLGSGLGSCLETAQQVSNTQWLLSPQHDHILLPCLHSQKENEPPEPPLSRPLQGGWAHTH